MTLRLELPLWHDLHAHFRQGEMLPALVRAHIAMGCAGILAMPNTSPPVAKVFDADPLPYASIESYRATLRQAGPALQDVIVPLYLTKDTDAAMIESGAKSGLLRAAKYYPPHGTTGAEFGAPLDLFMKNNVFAAMQDAGTILCIHGEQHGLEGAAYFDRATNAEDIFYTEHMPRLIDAFPDLKIVAEHLTTATAVEFVQQAPAHVAATVTPQHLLYTLGHLLKGLKYHLYCLPLIKFDTDRISIRDAVTAPGQTKFFAGTDSAPHAEKMTACGCAAGCYTGGIAPQLYAQGFEEAGVNLGSKAGFEAFQRFLCLNGPEFYGLKAVSKTFTLEKSPQDLIPLAIGSSEVLPLPLGLGQKTLNWRIIP